MLTDWKCPLESIPVGKGRCIKEGNDIALLTLGPIGKSVAGVVNDAEREGISVAHYDMRFLKPIDKELLHEVGKKFKYVITLEDGVIAGGLGTAVTEFMAENGYTPTIKTMGIPDTFVEHGSAEELYKLCKMDKEAVLEAVLNIKK